jgi:hypothetical protein
MKLLNTLLITLVLGSTAAGQTPQITIASPKVESPLPELMDSMQTREIFRQLLRQYSPSLSEIFRLDPALLTNDAFLEPYPKIREFLKQHPEVAHNPSFFVGDFFGRRINTPEERSYQVFESIMQGIAILGSGLILLAGFSWMVKTVIDHRRWLRVSRLQSEAHSKLLDRFNSNQDLLAYIQTPAGRHFLESAPVLTDPGSRAGAPYNRILFSVQLGIVLAVVGVGLHLVSREIAMQEISQPLFVLGMLSTALGIGFVLSAGAAYVLSRRLGLIEQPPLTPTSNNAGVSPPHA